MDKRSDAKGQIYCYLTPQLTVPVWRVVNVLQSVGGHYLRCLAPRAFGKTDYVFGSKSKPIVVSWGHRNTMYKARTSILDIDEDGRNDRIHVTKHGGRPEAASRIGERGELAGLTDETRKGEVDGNRDGVIARRTAYGGADGEAACVASRRNGTEGDTAALALREQHPCGHRDARQRDIW